MHVACLGRRLTCVTDGDDSAKSGVLAGGGEERVRNKWGTLGQRCYLAYLEILHKLPSSDRSPPLSESRQPCVLAFQKHWEATP